MMLYQQIFISLFGVLVGTYLFTGKRRHFIHILFKTLPRDILGAFRFLRVNALLWWWEKRGFTVARVFTRLVAAHPNKVAYITEDREWTYQQLEDFSNRLACYFRTRPLSRGDSVALVMEGCGEYVGTWLGMSKGGFVTALVNTNLREEVLVHSIRSAGCKAVIFGSELKHAIADIRDKIPDLTLYQWSDQKVPILEGAIDLSSVIATMEPGACLADLVLGCPRDKLIYIYTSGTTGMPKAAVINNLSGLITRCAGVFCYYRSDYVNVAKLCRSIAKYNLTHSPHSVTETNTVTVEILLHEDSVVTSISDMADWTMYMLISCGVHAMLGLRSTDRIYDSLPLYHTAGGVVGAGQALLRGIPVVLRKRFSASKFWPDCVHYECTVAQYIGEICRYLLAVPLSPNDTSHKVRLMFGNGLRPQIWKPFVDRFRVKQIGEFYGATEGNSNLVNIDNRVGAVGFVPLYAGALYPVALLRVDEETGEPIRNHDGLCIRCKPDEPGVFVGKINPKKAVNDFSGYADKTESEKKIIHDVFKKGDRVFNSGDILVMDEYGYFYFKDRTGDTFRWRGENVATAEVEAVISNVIGLKDAAVYGVEVVGNEGKAGMAAIYDPGRTLNLKDLSEGVKKALPSYARPLFVRVLSDLPMTGTFKLKKKHLQLDGFDVSKIEDPVYFLDKTGTYTRLTEELLKDILEGKIRI